MISWYFIWGFSLRFLLLLVIVGHIDPHCDRFKNSIYSSLSPSIHHNVLCLVWASENFNTSTMLVYFRLAHPEFAKTEWIYFGTRVSVSIWLKIIKSEPKPVDIVWLALFIKTIMIILTPDSYCRATWHFCFRYHFIRRRRKN